MFVKYYLSSYYVTDYYDLKSILMGSQSWQDVEEWAIWPQDVIMGSVLLNYLFYMIKKFYLTFLPFS